VNFVVEQAYAILNVVSEVRSNLPWTSILANGWVRGARQAEPPSRPGRSGQPCVMHARRFFRVAEVFKRV
jgi:hypothetical protein